MSQRSKAPIIIASLAGLAAVGAIGGIAYAASTGTSNVSPPQPKPPRPDNGKGANEHQKGLGPIPPEPKPKPKPRPEPEPSKDDLYGDLPTLQGANRPREVRAAAASIIKTARGRAAVGADSSDTIDGVTDAAFMAVFGSTIGVGKKLTKDNPTHAPYIKAWVRIRGDVGRMMSNLSAIAKGNPFKGQKTRSMQYVLWSLVVSATSPITAAGCASAFYYARAYLSEHQAQLRPMLGKGSPSLGEAGLLAELAVRLNQKASLPPGEPWGNWSAAAKAANGLWPAFA